MNTHDSNAREGACQRKVACKAQTGSGADFVLVLRHPDGGPMAIGGAAATLLGAQLEQLADGFQGGHLIAADADGELLVRRLHRLLGSMSGVSVGRARA